MGMTKAMLYLYLFACVFLTMPWSNVWWLILNVPNTMKIHDLGPCKEDSMHPIPSHEGVVTPCLFLFHKEIQRVKITHIITKLTKLNVNASMKVFLLKFMSSFLWSDECQKLQSWRFTCYESWLIQMRCMFLQLWEILGEIHISLLITWKLWEKLNCD